MRYTFELDNDLCELQEKLDNHPIYESIDTLKKLQCFVEHHIYSVWDFMSLVKYLQFRLAPASYPWFPQASGDITRFINEIVLEEESDELPNGLKYSSHFQIYQNAMIEIGADIKKSVKFIQLVKDKGIEEVLDISDIPLAAKNFISTTFEFIKTDKLHVITSAFTFGRETIIPVMFRSIINKLGVSEDQCPTFYYYINRHIEVDDFKHGPMAINLLGSICGSDKVIFNEALESAKTALRARIDFWNDISHSINEIKNTESIESSI